MPKVGQEPIRRAALVSATIEEIGRAGSLDVTVRQIARRAGMSTALAHYYFDGKQALFMATMRHILSEFATQVRRRLKPDQDPRQRLSAIIQASLGPEQFDGAVVSAWLVFYVEAQRSQQARRLLNIYLKRLHSNLMHELRQLLPPRQAARTAQGLAALIDGLYLRAGMHAGVLQPEGAAALAQDYLKTVLPPQAEA